MISRRNPRVFCELCSQKTPRGILPMNSNFEKADHEIVLLFHLKLNIIYVFYGDDFAVCDTAVVFHYDMSEIAPNLLPDDDIRVPVGKIEPFLIPLNEN